MDFTQKLSQVLDLQEKIADLNPLFQQHYPVVVAVDDQFLIHEVDPVIGRYTLTRQAPVPFSIPKGIRAAFPFEELDGETAAVVTPDVFDSFPETVLILHEFVHCFQAATCEEKLKSHLEIARLSEAEGNGSWELNTPFPYESAPFTRLYGINLAALKADDADAVKQARVELRAVLAPLDWEYMVWQEWKEGYARWVENQIQRRLGLSVNTYGETPPYNRISFYVGGAAYFTFLAKREPEAMTDLPGLFTRLMALGGMGA